MITVPLLKLPHGQDLPLPSYGTPMSAGLDLMAAIDEPVIIKPFERKLIPTGISIALPKGYEAQIRPRSGLALKNGLTVLNSPGTIDADYRGEIQIILINLGQLEFKVERGLRIAQMILSPVSQLTWAEIETHEELEHNERREKGFGSTGLMQK